ncbi:MAG: radical SAM protein, partial [Elusimicrobiota bacterium]
MTGTERCAKAPRPSTQGPGLRDFRRLSPGSKLALAVLNTRLAALPPGVPRAVFLGLTRRCQLRCVHCRYRQGAYRGPLPPDMPFPLARKALRLAAAAGIPRVIFFGGEPTLYARLPELVREAAGLGLFPELDTNGLLLRDKAFLAGLRSAGLAAVRVSL